LVLCNIAQVAENRSQSDPALVTFREKARCFGNPKGGSPAGQVLISLRAVSEAPTSEELEI